jgi:hypothetical protein
MLQMGRLLQMDLMGRLLQMDQKVLKGQMGLLVLGVLLNNHLRLLLNTTDLLVHLVCQSTLDI